MYLLSLILPRELVVAMAEALKLHPLGKEHITKGATMKTNGFLSTFNDWMPNPGRPGFFCKLLLRQSIHLNKIFLFLFFLLKKFFAFKVPWEIVKLKVDKSPHLWRSTSSKGRRRFSFLISRVLSLIAFRGFVASSSRSRSRGARGKKIRRNKATPYLSLES